MGITVAAAAIVAVVPGAADSMRAALQLRLKPTPGERRDAIDYLITNVRVVSAIFLSAHVRSRCGVLGRLLDTLVALVIVGNVTLVGAPLGAYGFVIAPWLVHLPAEWLALAIAGRVFFAAALPRPLHAPAVMAYLGVTLVVAAALEAFVTPPALTTHRAPPLGPMLRPRAAEAVCLIRTRLVQPSTRQKDLGDRGSP